MAKTPRVPKETPMFDADGRMSRTWVLFLEKLGVSGGTEGIIAYNPEYPGAIQRDNWYKHGERPSVKDWGAKGDAVILDDLVTASGDATATSAAASFTRADIGKSLVVLGAGSSGAGDRESLIAEAVDSASATDLWAAVDDSVLDAQAGTTVKYALNCRDYDVDWEVYGDNAADFSSEAKVYGSATQAALDASDSYSVSTPPYRYYRVKIKNTVAGENSIAFITSLVLGYLHSTTIASVTDASTIEMADAATATRAACAAHYGTDDTAAIQGAIDALADSFTDSGNGGLVLYVPRGIYLISDQIIQKRAISIQGSGGSGCHMLANAAEFPIDTAVWQIGDTLAIQGAPSAFTMLSDVRIDCFHVPGSIGIYSETVQENSGCRRVAVVKWMDKGVHFYYYGCQHFQMDDVWTYSSTACFENADAIGIHLDTVISPNPVRRVTAYGQGGHIAGYGTGVKITNAEASIHDLHVESCAYGVDLDTGATGTIQAISGHQSVETLIRITTSNPVGISHFGNTGKHVILDTQASSRYFDDSLQSYHRSAKAPVRFRGHYSTDGDIVQFIPGSHLGGYAGARITRKGKLLFSDERTMDSPNVIVHEHANFSGPTQGGFIAVNSQLDGYPNWAQASTRYVFTADAGTDVITCTSHPFSENDDLQLASDDTLPGGLSAGPDQTYYAKNVVAGVSFQVSLTPAGAAVDITGAGTGPHYASIYAGAVFVRMGARRFEVRHGAAVNAGGTNPGDSLFLCDPDTGVVISRLYMAAGTELPIGNELDIYRARMWHGHTNQSHFRIERSVDSGASWVRGLLLDLSDGSLLIGGAFFPSGQETAAMYSGSGSPEGAVAANIGSIYLDYTNGEVYRKKSGSGNTGWLIMDGITDLSDSATIDGTGLTSGRLLQWDGSAVVNGAADLGDADDVAGTGLTASQWLKWDATGKVVSSALPAQAAADLGDAGDVDGSGLTSGRQLQWDGSKVVNATAGDFDSLDVGGGDMTVDGSGNTDVNSLDVQGNTAIDAFRNAELASTLKIAGTQVLGTRKTGWASPTGSFVRSSFATSTVTLEELAQRVAALIADMTSHGSIGS